MSNYKVQGFQFSSTFDLRLLKIINARHIPPGIVSLFIVAIQAAWLIINSSPAINETCAFWLLQIFSCALRWVFHSVHVSWPPLTRLPSDMCV